MIPACDYEPLEESRQNEEPNIADLRHFHTHLSHRLIELRELYELVAELHDLG
jgi:hypothetical protein